MWVDGVLSPEGERPTHTAARAAIVATAITGVTMGMAVVVSTIASVAAAVAWAWIAEAAPTAWARCDPLADGVSATVKPDNLISRIDGAATWKIAYDAAGPATVVGIGDSRNSDSQGGDDGKDGEDCFHDGVGERLVCVQCVRRDTPGLIQAPAIFFPTTRLGPVIRHL